MPSGQLSVNYDQEQEEDVKESERARNQARVGGVNKLEKTVNNQAIKSSIQESTPLKPDLRA